MRSRGRHADARNVAVDAAPVLVCPQHLHGEIRVCLEQPAEVVVIGDAGIAASGRDGLENAGVAVDVLRLVGYPASHDLFGACLSVGRDETRHQGLGVDVGRRSQTEATTPLPIGERLIGGDL